jgi:hypothetical protein
MEKGIGVTFFELKSQIISELSVEVFQPSRGVPVTNNAMFIRKISLSALIVFSCIWVDAQSTYQIDTIPTFSSTHMDLRIDIPVGEIHMGTSGICGASVSRVLTPDPQILQRVHTTIDPNGNLIRVVNYEHPRARQEQNSALARTAASDLRVSTNITDAEISAGESYKAEYLPDPSMSTSLYVDLGVGASRLDLSGLSLTGVDINSAFSDVTVTYSQPNLVTMEKMDVHAAKANLVLKNLEYARAEMITIQNDMGETKVIIGNGYFPGSTFFIQSGVGSCSLIIHKKQPVQIILRKGFFSSLELPESYQLVSKGVYANEAFVTNPEKGIKIICNIDFGNISVIEND